jgi:hypothetical protein
VLSLSHPELTERLAILLEVRRSEVVDFVLPQEGVLLHACLETEKPAKLRRRECMRPLGFERQAFEGCSRQVLPPGFESVCIVLRQFQRDLHGDAFQFMISRYDLCEL